MSNNEGLMNRDKQMFIDKIEDLKFLLKLHGIDLIGIRTEPRLGTAAKKMLKEKGVEVV